jgi:hypothetical protein
MADCLHQREPQEARRWGELSQMETIQTILILSVIGLTGLTGIAIGAVFGLMALRRGASVS